MMHRVHDVGGRRDDLAPVEREADEPPFHAEWEARVFALNAVLLRSGTYTLDAFRAAIEAIEPARYQSLSYYERWLVAIETLLAERGLGPE